MSVIRRAVVCLFCTIVAMAALADAPKLGSAVTLAVPRVTGDFDGDGAVAIADIFHSINGISGGGPAPSGYGDVNGDANVNNADVGYLVSYLFDGGPRPMEPWRLAEQATFGPTDTLVDHIRTVGFNTFLNEQFAATPSGYPSMTPMPQTRDNVTCVSGSTCERDNYTMWPLQTRFFTNALYSNDQLRQRVAWALHKLMVVSGNDITMPSQMTPYLQTIDRNALGSYRTLLKEITLNPAMGRYLDMVTSTRTNPNENYAREILQLFSVGTDRLNLDGTQQRDGNGDVIPTYDQNVIGGFSQIFTGWTYAAPQTGYESIVNYQDPLVPGPATTHDTAAKLLLNGVTQPAGQTIQSDLDAAIDNVFNHPNAGPFISRHLIQNLVTSNPSPAYVARVAAVFNNNGAGARGDLKEVVRAILLDVEARNDAPPAAQFGHLREPALFITSVGRAFNIRSASGAGSSDGYLNPLSDSMGQNIFRPPTVFSYFPPDYIAPGTGGYLGPEFGIMSTTTVMSRANIIDTLVYNGVAAGTVNTPNGTSLDLSALQSLAGDPTAMVAELNRLLMHGTMSTSMRDSIVTAVNAVAASDPVRRTRQAVYLVCTSSQYQVER